MGDATALDATALSPPALHSVIVHASTVAWAGRALLIRGASGAGKSSLALRLMALGAGLVADDRTIVTPRPDGPPRVAAPAPLAGMIEARGVGLLAAAPVSAAALAAIVDLDTAEPERLPPPRRSRLAGYELDLFLNADGPAFAAALLQYLKAGRCPV